MTNDIKVVGNVICGRQGIAYICNSHEYPIIEVDLDKDQEYQSFKTFGMVNVAWDYKNQENFENCTLEFENGKWSFGSAGFGLTDSFGFEDIMECVSNNNLPTVRANEVVVLAFISKKNRICTLNLYRVSERINIHCQTVATLTELNDEEMNEIVIKGNCWCNR